MKKINEKDYHATLKEEQNILFLSGRLRLSGQDAYRPIIELFEQLVALEGDITLDIQNLEFLNSSGIAMFSRFMLSCRKRGTGIITVLGSKEIAWQKKSLTNLQRLLPALVLEIL